MIKYILLGFLNCQPMTGYEIKQSIDSSTAHFWNAYHSQIYTMLLNTFVAPLVNIKPIWRKFDQVIKKQMIRAHKMAVEKAGTAT